MIHALRWPCGRNIFQSTVCLLWEITAIHPQCIDLTTMNGNVGIFYGYLFSSKDVIILAKAGIALSFALALIFACDPQLVVERKELAP